MRLFSVRSIGSLTANTARCLINEAGDSWKRQGDLILKIEVTPCICLKGKKCLIFDLLIKPDIYRWATRKAGSAAFSFQFTGIFLTLNYLSFLKCSVCICKGPLKKKKKVKSSSNSLYCLGLLFNLQVYKCLPLTSLSIK